MGVKGIARGTSGGGSYTLPVATNVALGGIKASTGLVAAGDGALSVDSIAVTGLPAASALSGADIILLNQGGVDVRSTLAALQTFLGVAVIVATGATAPVTMPTTGTSGVAISGLTTTLTPTGATAYAVLHDGTADVGARQTFTGTAVPSLTPASAGTYTVKIYAALTGGSALATSAVDTVSAPLTAPNAVTSLAAGTVTTTTIPLTWVESGGAPSSRTVTQRTPSGSGSFVASAGTFTSTGGTVTGLTASTAYDFQVVETNSAGSSPPTFLTNASTAAASSGPAFLPTLSGGTTLLASWDTQAAGVLFQDIAGTTASTGSTQPAANVWKIGDASGNGHDLTQTETTNAAFGPVLVPTGINSNKAVHMDAACKVLTARSANAWAGQLKLGSWTAAFAFRTDASAADAYLLNFADTAGSSGGNIIYLETAGARLKLHRNINTLIEVDDVTVLAANTTYKVAMRYDATAAQLSISVNGNAPTTVACPVGSTGNAFDMVCMGGLRAGNANSFTFGQLTVWTGGTTANFASDATAIFNALTTEFGS